MLENDQTGKKANSQYIGLFKFFYVFFWQKDRAG